MPSVLKHVKLEQPAPHFGRFGHYIREFQTFFGKVESEVRHVDFYFSKRDLFAEIREGLWPRFDGDNAVSQTCKA